MAILRILALPEDEALLRRRAAEVTDFGDGLHAIARDMMETLPVTHGIGLAAPQVGHSLRMVLIDISGIGDEREAGAPKPPPPFFLVNPVIEEGDGSACLAEGCLSVPGLRVEVPRMARIAVTAWTLDRQPVRFEAHDLLAIVIQHELDHLEGRLIVDWAAKGFPAWREDEAPFPECARPGPGAEPRPARSARPA